MNAGTYIEVETKLRWIAEKSKRKPEMVFCNLLHLFDRPALRNCYRELDGRKALGVDKVSKDVYGEKLSENVDKLVEAIHTMKYIPQAVRQVLIPKEGKKGATRPLGISNFEDKMFQKMMQKVLESVYEPLFKEYSYGFRPNRGCHTAIKALMDYLHRNETETVIDVDIANFFGSISHKELMNILCKKISDTRLLRYIARMFKAGILAEGELTISDEGVPQGSVCSPVLANIFAHEVIDVWFEEMVKPNCAGKVEMFRYADDVVIVCQYKKDGERIKTSLEKRLEKYAMKLNTEKTKLVRFSKVKARKGIQQESFDFLGFTFYLGRSRKRRIIPKLKTSGKRMRSKLAKVNKWAKEVRNKVELAQMWKVCCTKLNGHIRYFGVSHNIKRVAVFRHKVEQIMFKWINRRSDRGSMTWDEYELFKKMFPLPMARIYVELF